MKKIRLIRLTMENFKGCASRTFEFNGRDAVISGANGTGKTTVYNALTWLLFDKIAGDDGKVMSAPDIKPNGETGEVLDHAAVSKVNAVFSVDGTLISLRREFHENWTQQRGSSEKTMTGHTSEYYWDDVPVQLQEFKARLEERFTTESVFWTLSNVHWFCRGMDWKKRRDLLTDVCGLPDDRAIMDANPEFAELSAAMNGLPLSDFRTWLDAQIKKLNGAQRTYPARLDEVLNQVRKYAATDFVALRSARDSKDAGIRAKTDELSRLDNGTQIASIRNELQSVRNQARELELENQRYRQSQTPPPDNHRPELETNLRQWQSAQTDAERRVTTEQSLIERLDAQIVASRNDYRALNADLAKVTAETFTDAVCPMCGQTLPPDAQEKARQQFETGKDRRKKEIGLRQSDICNRAGELKANREAAQTRKREAEQAAEKARQNVDALTEKLASCRASAAPVISDLPEYADKHAEFDRRIAELEQKIAQWNQESAKSRDNINREMSGLSVVEG